MLRRSILLASCLLFALVWTQGTLSAQHSFTMADTLRGSLNEMRRCYDVQHYALDLALEPSDSSISGTVQVAFVGRFASTMLQIDLDSALILQSAVQAGKRLGVIRVGAAIFIELARPTRPGQPDTLLLSYEGRPHVAENPPWDGGLIWKTDSLGRPFYSVSCEGIGASIWWPNKDHLSDEPDSLSFSLRVPNPLRVVSNGQFRAVEMSKTHTRFRYAVTYPINNYNVTFYVGHYLSFTDTLHSSSKDKPLLLSYDVLDYNLDRAKAHFAQVKPMLRCYASYFGDYPFWRDGYRLVEAPMLGMEHQSGIAYGNRYQIGYNGGMIPEGMDWDYLIIHESGHEYFGNALSAVDHAEMWLHESFTTYLEALYVECRYGHDEYENYLLSQVGFIQNSEPIVGPIGVNFTEFGGNDHYFKGSWMIHTFRSLVGDEAFLALLREFYEQHAIGQVTTSDWLAAVGKRFGAKYESFFRQYLYQPGLPTLHVRRHSDTETIAFFEGAIPGFGLDLQVGAQTISISDEPQVFALNLKAWRALRKQDYLLIYVIAEE